MNENSIMDIFYGIHFNKPKCGFCNQLYSIARSVLNTRELNKKIIVIDSYLNEIDQKESTPISQILDLPKTNQYLLEKFNVFIMDYHHHQIQIHKIELIHESNMIDITSKIQHTYDRDSKIKIPIQEDFIQMYSLPLEKKNTNIRIYIQCDQEIICWNCDYETFLKRGFQIDLQKVPLENLLKWREPSNIIQFNEIIKNIKFHPRFYHIVDEEFQKIQQTMNILSSSKTHSIHIRLEDDAIQHWSQLNNTYIELYKTVVESKYIRYIWKRIPKDELIILHTYDENNEVVKFLQRNQYKYYIRKKDIRMGREVNAIIDLLMSERCDGYIFGAAASTFSQTIMARNPFGYNHRLYMFNNHIIAHPIYEIDEHFFTDNIQKVLQETKQPLFFYETSNLK